MKVSVLKKILGGCFDTDEVLIPGSDHSFRGAKAHIEDVELSDGDYYEYYGDEFMNESGKRIKALIIE